MSADFPWALFHFTSEPHNMNPLPTSTSSSTNPTRIAGLVEAGLPGMALGSCPDDCGPVGRSCGPLLGGDVGRGVVPLASEDHLSVCCSISAHAISWAPHSMAKPGGSKPRVCMAVDSGGTDTTREKPTPTSIVTGGEQGRGRLRGCSCFRDSHGIVSHGPLPTSSCQSSTDDSWSWSWPSSHHRSIRIGSLPCVRSLGLGENQGDEIKNQRGFYHVGGKIKTFWFLMDTWVWMMTFK